MHAEELTRFHESRMVREHRFEPRDPVAAHTGLAVRQPLNARAERRTDLFKHFRGVGHRHTADEINVATHAATSPRKRRRGFSEACARFLPSERVPCRIRWRYRISARSAAPRPCAPWHLRLRPWRARFREKAPCRF